MSARRATTTDSGGGGVVPAPVLHRAELAALSDRFATVVAVSAALP